MAQRQYQTSVGFTSDPASLSPTADRKASEKGGSRQGTSKERGLGRDRNLARPSPLHTLESSNLPDEDPLPSDRSGFIFYSDDGGFRATDDHDREWHGGLGGKKVVDGKIVGETETEKGGIPDDGEGVVYYLGIIDVLTRWTCLKRLEHIWKGLKADHVSQPFLPIFHHIQSSPSSPSSFFANTRFPIILQHKISPVNPNEYGDRFFAFLQAVMRGGGGGDRFV